MESTRNPLIQAIRCGQSQGASLENGLVVIEGPAFVRGSAGQRMEGGAGIGGQFRASRWAGFTTALASPDAP